MHKTLLVLAASVALATPAAAQNARYGAPPYVAPVAGAAAGTTVALGLYNGWWNAGAVPATAVGAAATGFVAAAGTVALVHALTTPCMGAHFLLGGFYGGAENSGCVNGQYVGRQAQLVERTVVTRPAPTVRRRR